MVTMGATWSNCAINIPLSAIIADNPIAQKGSPFLVVRAKMSSKGNKLSLATAFKSRGAAGEQTSKQKLLYTIF